MIDETNASSGDMTRGCLICIVIVVIGTFIYNYTNKEVLKPAKENKWYEGGTLHNAKIYEWRKATDKNKIATCADIVAHVHKEISYTKTYALLVCIETAIKDNPNADQLEVSQVAAGCEMLIQN